MIIKADIKQLLDVKRITQQTISEIYPKYYPKGVVEFFKKHHNDENIKGDINAGMVYLFTKDDVNIGTVTLKENEICRLFVLPEFQHKGYGRELLEFAEEKISEKYSEIILDASLPAKKIYKMRGYKETEYHQIISDNQDILCYDVMKKEVQ